MRTWRQGYILHDCKLSELSVHAPLSRRWWNPHLDGGFPRDVGDEEVHGNVLTVDVFIHHVSDGLGHHVRIQVGIILSGVEKESYSVRGHSSSAFSKNTHGSRSC